MRFRLKQHSTAERFSKVRNYIIAVVVFTMVPASFMTVSIIRKSIFDNNVRNFVKNELAFNGTYVMSNGVDKENKVLNIVAVGREIARKEIEGAQHKMSDYGMDGFRLSVVQSSRSDSLLMLNTKLSDASNANDINSAKLLEQSSKIHNLERRLYGYTQYDSLSKVVIGETGILFPSVRTLILSRATEVYADTSAASSYTVAIVGLDNKVAGSMSVRERGKLRQWLKSRLRADSLRVIVAGQ